MNFQKRIMVFLLITAASVLVAGDKTVVVFGNDITVEADQRVDAAIAFGGDVDVYGEVRESVVAVGGDVFIHPGAEVEGDAVSIGGEVILDSNANLDGDLVEVKSGHFGHAFRHLHFNPYWGVPWAFRAISMFGLLAIVLIVGLLFPGLIVSPASGFELEPGKTFLIGIAAVILFIPLLILLAISIIGIPLIPLVIFCYGLAYLVGYLIVGYLLGKRFLTALNIEAKTLLMNSVSGVLILWFVNLIPFIGILLRICLFLVGLGVILLSLSNLRNTPKPQVV